MFIKVKIDNLNELSKEIPDTVRSEVSKKRDMIKTIKDKKYLSISIFVKLTFKKRSLFKKKADIRNWYWNG